MSPTDYFALPAKRFMFTFMTGTRQVYWVSGDSIFKRYSAITVIRGERFCAKWGPRCAVGLALNTFWVSYKIIIGHLF